jgi:hypothetical protein
MSRGCWNRVQSRITYVTSIYDLGKMLTHPRVHHPIIDDQDCIPGFATEVTVPHPTQYHKEYLPALLLKTGPHAQPIFMSEGCAWLAAEPKEGEEHDVKKHRSMKKM